MYGKVGIPCPTFIVWLQSVVGSTTVEAGASVASTFDEKERMVVAIINRICIFAITYFTDKSKFE